MMVNCNNQFVEFGFVFVFGIFVGYVDQFVFDFSVSYLCIYDDVEILFFELFFGVFGYLLINCWQECVLGFQYSYF